MGAIWVHPTASANAAPTQLQPGSITVMASQAIDLTGVDVDEIEITAFTAMGGLEIIVPQGAEVDHTAMFIVGAHDINVEPPAGTPTIRVRVRSWGMTGAYEINNRRDDGD